MLRRGAHRTAHRSFFFKSATAVEERAAPGPELGSLEGKICWVIGGAGQIGTGLVRGLLRAGGTVICNSRHELRLKALTTELGHPEKLIAFQGSMMPGEAEDTINRVMNFTAGQLDHVVVHSAVRWWGSGSCTYRDGDETGTLAALGTSGSGSILDLSVSEFGEHAVVLPQMQFAACRLLVPRLTHVDNASYTFVTGGGGEDARSSLGQINAQAVWGLAAALRSETNQKLRVSEVRVGLKFNRTVEERRAEPRETPLSHDVGTICAGIAAAEPGGGAWRNALHELDCSDDVARAKADFPALDRAYTTFFSPEENLM